MNNNTKKGALTIAQFLIALLILIFMSAPALIVGGDNYYSAMEMFTGYKWKNVAMMGFSFPNLIPYILLAVLLVFDYLKYAIAKLNNKYTRFAMAAGFVIIGVMLLLAKFMLNDVNEGAGFNKLDRDIAWGSIVQSIAAFICAILCFLDALLPFESIDEEEDEPEEEEKESVEDLKKQLADEMNSVNDAKIENAEITEPEKQEANKTE